MVNGEEIVFFKVDLVCVDNENDWMKKRGSPIKLWNSIAIPIPHGPINACFEFDPFLIQITWLNSKVIIYFFLKWKGGKLFTWCIFLYSTKMGDQWNDSTNMKVYLSCYLCSVWLQSHKKKRLRSTWIVHVPYLYYQAPKSPHTYASLLKGYLQYTFSSLTDSTTIYICISFVVSALLSHVVSSPICTCQPKFQLFLF